MSKRRKRAKQATVREQISRLQHAINALGKHVDGLHQTVATMRHQMSVAGSYLGADAYEPRRGDTIYRTLTGPKPRRTK